MYCLFILFYFKNEAKVSLKIPNQKTQCTEKDKSKTRTRDKNTLVI